MKTILTGIFLGFCLLLPLQAKWSQLPKRELVQSADAIVIANFKGYQMVDQVDSFYNQLGFFTVVQTLKGQVPDSFGVYGTGLQITSPLFSFQELKPGPYLLCLSRRKYGWVDCNGFIQHIKDGKVVWFVDNQTNQKKVTLLSKVVNDINSIASGPVR